MVRFLKISAFYPGYIEQTYARHAGLADKDYAPQHAALMAGRFSWSDSWQRHLEAMGGYEVMEVIANAEPLQKQWARAHGVEWRVASWRTDVVLAQIAQFRPQVLFLHWNEPVSRDFVARLREDLPELYIISYDGIALMDAQKYAGCNLILTPLDFCIDYYRQHGFESMKFVTGFDPLLLSELRSKPHHRAVGFVGGLYLGENGHRRRAEVLAAVARRFPVQLNLDLPSTWRWARLKWARRDQIRQLSDLLAEFALLRTLSARANKPLYGLEMYEALHSCLVSLNVHIDAAKDRAANMRLFEVTGVGSCLLTDWKSNLPEYFDVDREIVAFRSVEECIEKLKYLVANPGVAGQIAERGQRRTLRDHNTGNLIRDVAGVVQAGLHV